MDVQNSILYKNMVGIQWNCRQTGLSNQFIAMLSLQTNLLLQLRRILPPSNPAPQKLKMELTFLWISILHQLPQSWGPSTASHNPGGSVRGVSTRTDTTLEGENSHQTRAQSLNSDSMKILYYNTRSLIPKLDELYKDPMWYSYAKSYLYLRIIAWQKYLRWWIKYQQ